MTTIQPLTPRWWSEYSCAIKGIPLPQCPTALLVQPSQDVRFRPVVLAIGQALENPVLGGVFLCQGSGIAGPVALGSFGISGISGTGT